MRKASATASEEAAAHPAGAGPPSVADLRPRQLALWLLTAGALYLALRVVQPFVAVLLGAVVLAVLFAPLNDHLRRRTGHRNLPALFTLLVAVVVFLLPISLITFAVAAEVSAIAAEAPEKVENLLENPDVKQRAAELRTQALERFPFLARFDPRRLTGSLGPLGEKLLERSLEFAGGVVQTLVRFVLIAFTLFFLLRDGAALADHLRDILPLDRRSADELLARLVDVLRASTYGVVLVAAIQGALGAAMFAVLGLPSPALWGVVMALFAMIPVAGSGIVWLPASLYLFATGASGKALVLLLWGALVVASIDNLLRPRIVGKRARMHELVVFFGVLGGLEVFGLVGVVVGPAVLAVTATLLSVARNGGVLRPTTRGTDAAA